MRGTANFFWFRGQLGLYEKICIESFLKNGFKVNLHSYEPYAAEQIPGVKWIAANTILSNPEDFNFTQNKKSFNYAAFSDVYRLKIQEKEMGWYFDTDVICLKNVKDFEQAFKECDFIIGRQDHKLVNGAALLIDNYNHVQNLLSEISIHPRLIKWGDIGPVLLTRYCEEHGISSWAEHVFYPTHYVEALDIFDPDYCDHILVRTKNSFTLHLWNEILNISTLNKKLLPHKNSAISKLGNIEDDCAVRRMTYFSVKSTKTNRRVKQIIHDVYKKIASK